MRRGAQLLCIGDDFLVCNMITELIRDINYFTGSSTVSNNQSKTGNIYCKASTNQNTGIICALIGCCFTTVYSKIDENGCKQKYEIIPIMGDLYWYIP